MGEKPFLSRVYLDLGSIHMFIVEDRNLKQGLYFIHKLDDHFEPKPWFRNLMCPKEVLNKIFTWKVMDEMVSVWILPVITFAGFKPKQKKDT